MEDFSLLYLNHGKTCREWKGYKPFFSALTKKTRRRKEYATFGCSNIFYDSGLATGPYFLKFPSLPSEINC